MANKQVVDLSAYEPVAGQIGTFNIARPEHVYTAYGTISAADYAVGDTLQLVSLGMRELIHARFVAPAAEIEFTNGTSTTSPIAFDVMNSGAAADISYMITYLKGSGTPMIQLTIASSVP